MVAEVTHNGKIGSKGYSPLDARGHSRFLLLVVAEYPKKWLERQDLQVEKEKLAFKYPSPTLTLLLEAFSTRDRALILDDGRITTWLFLVATDPFPL
jgi:hypothetical protein